MGTTRLNIYKNALSLCGERGVSTLSDETKGRRLLDQVWDSNGVRYCLEQDQWQFAMRTQMIDYDPSTDPPFGYRRAFNKPDDWVLTSAFCSDEFFKVPIDRYADELDFWYADVDVVYVKFVSDDTDYGSDLSTWPQTFCDYVDAYFASKVIFDLTSDKQRVEFLLGSRGSLNEGELARRLKIAKSRAAMTQPARKPAQGSWTSARGAGPRGDRGSQSNLIG